MEPFETVIVDDFDAAEDIAAFIRQTYFGVIGFDTETQLYRNRRQGPIDTIQMYLEYPHGNICYIFHVASWNANTLPQSLAKIIRSKQIVKAVAAPENDARWLQEDFRITMAGYIDVQTLAVQLGESKIGLDALAAKYIKGWTGKKKDMHLSPWAGVLSDEMIEYAANDAYASYAVLKAIFPSFFHRVCEKCHREIDAKALLEQLNHKLLQPEPYHEVLRKCNVHLWPRDMHPKRKQELSQKLVREWLDRGWCHEIGGLYVLQTTS